VSDDARLRELERAFRAAGAATDEGAWLAEQARLGLVALPDLALRAALGEVGPTLACEALGPRLLLLLFTASWSGPDRIHRPRIAVTFERLADLALRRIVDVDAEPELTARLGVRAVPTLLAFAGGHRLGEMVGVHEQGRLDAWTDEQLLPLPRSGRGMG
jgi:hypothetical protein